jgi:hypothetical protein
VLGELSKDQPETVRAKMEERTIAEFANSPQKIFFEENGRGIRPLRGQVEILESGLLTPADKKLLESQQATSALLAGSVGNAFAGVLEAAMSRLIPPAPAPAAPTDAPAAADAKKGAKQ